MSSSLYLFDLSRHALPLPTSFEDLESLRQTLLGKPDGKNLRFIEFALRFEDRFPVRAGEAAGRAGSPGPLDRASAVRCAAWHFDLPFVETMPAYRAAVEIAGALGLVAYDPELGIGFLPDGQVIPAEFAQSDTTVPPADDTLRGEEEVRAVLAPALTRVLASHGFALEPEPAGSLVRTISLARTLGPVRQRLHVQLGRYEEVALMLQVEHDACTAVYVAAHGQESHADDALRLSLKFFTPGLDGNHRWYLERRSQLAPLLEMVRDKLLPLAELSRDLTGLDQLLNDDSADTIRTPYKTAYSWLGRPAGSDGSRSLREEFDEHPARLVIAHLNGNPSTPRIAEWFDAHYADAQQARGREAYLKLREALASTAPLAHWPDRLAYRASMRTLPQSLLHREFDPRGRRCHHWEVTESLHQALSKDPAQFWGRFAGESGLLELQRLWREKADTLPPSERIESVGLACRLTTVGAPAQAGDIQVLLLEFPPIQGLDECAVLALARVGETYRRYRMGHHHSLENDAIQTQMAFQVKSGIIQRQLPGLLSAQEFLDFVRGTFESNV
ncbi:hypothetical protein QTH89_24685 [Variovorax sp. J22G21]|uniref:hypothetical protein n=1 Tax=Variovorax fucosicus TaxID=3053517 RepID=UPI00257920F5|nr:MULTISPECIES: hypothetical protein [unclassified Variovorax]MDM0039661.1 hypothetical protein [Variovorax sp. J22R193]MDM0064436.1 hypothetical protein [Variovorax sp. J22G21]